MKYEVVLQGNKNFTVNESQKKEIENHWLSKDGYVIAVGGNTIDTKTIKGIFETKEIDYSNQENKFKHDSTNFSKQLELSSKWTPEQKSKRDMKIRILPGWIKSGGRREDKEMMEVYKTILEFFTKDTEYPYCPAEIWWPIIREKIKAHGQASSFFNYVFLHDIQVKNWVKGVL